MLETEGHEKHNSNREHESKAEDDEGERRGRRARAESVAERRAGHARTTNVVSSGCRHREAIVRDRRFIVLDRLRGPRFARATAPVFESQETFVHFRKRALNVARGAARAS